MDLAVLLRSWDYQEAKDFYLQHGDNQTFIGMLSGIKTSYVEKRLRQEIQKLAQNSENQDFTKSNTEVNTPKFAQKLTPEVTAIAQRWKSNYKKASRLQMFLGQAPDDETRKKMAFEILDLMDLVHDDWDNLAYYEVHGTFLPTQIRIELSTFDKADLMQRLRTLRTYLSPSKSNIYDTDQRALFQAEISEITKVLIEIDTS